MTDPKLKQLVRVVSCAVLVGCGLALAQGPGGGGPPDGPDGPMMPPPDRQQAVGAPNSKQMLARFSKVLKLSDDQKAKIKPILETRQRQIEQIAKSASSREDAMQSLASIEDKSWMAIRPLLNESQQKKFDVLTKQMAERRERAAREDADELPPPDGPPPDGPPPGGGGPPL